METNQTAPGAGPVPEDAQGDSASAGQQAEGAVGSASAADATGTGFYAWLRRLGVPRRAGWLGGVCAGVGARLGIDPIIVRGIVVVVAVLGAPFVLLYAISRFFIEFYRGDERGFMFNAVSTSQGISIILAPLALFMLWYLSRPEQPLAPEAPRGPRKPRFA